MPIESKRHPGTRALKKFFITFEDSTGVADILAKILAFFIQITAIYAEKMIITLLCMKIAENCDYNIDPWVGIRTPVVTYYVVSYNRQSVCPDLFAALPNVSKCCQRKKLVKCIKCKSDLQASFRAKSTCRSRMMVTVMRPTLFIPETRENHAHPDAPVQGDRMSL
jgi:hypothetical protein